MVSCMRDFTEAKKIQHSFKISVSSNLQIGFANTPPPRYSLECPATTGFGTNKKGK